MKKILIMGATSGIGLHAAIAFAEKGYTVGAAGRNTAQLALLSDRFPRNVVTRRIDVDDADAPMQLHDLVEEMEGMDIYFHVAGIGFENAALHELEETEVVETNAVGFARMVCAAFRWFRDHNEGRGHIAAITSVAGTNGIETARRLRQADPEVLIVFVTSSPEYVWDAFPVHPLHRVRVEQQFSSARHRAGLCRDGGTQIQRQSALGDRGANLPGECSVKSVTTGRPT